LLLIEYIAIFIGGFMRLAWVSDTHLTFPLDKFHLLNCILDAKPNAVIHSGDITQWGFNTISSLKYIGKRIGRPFYFVLGNHPIWFSSFKYMYDEVRKLCREYENLIWLEDISFLTLKDDIAICGAEGFYDGRVGNSKYLKYTFDWFLIEELRNLSSMERRLEKFKELADYSAKCAIGKLEAAFQNHNTVYFCTHYPIFSEANRTDWFSEAFWEPYNTNVVLGNAIKFFMKDRPKKKLIVLSGHIHTPSTTIYKNIECRVGRGNYLKLSEEEMFYI
jgi:3',5'-cyclic AMP phosphodiesterase CpdA